jgi:Zn finger protein HypA/HybF involved in hydrogenase expression
MKTTFREIAEYWASHHNESSLSIDWFDAEILCWRCSEKRNLERCHIIPRSLGGSEEPNNLILLCKECHSEAPNVNDSTFMWLWLKAHAQPFYRTYWTQRAIKEFELIFGAVDFSFIEREEEYTTHFRAMLSELFKNTSTHFGHGGRLNTSSLAWLMHETVKQVEAKYKQ